MSPTKRPSSVEGLRRGVGPAPAAEVRAADHGAPVTVSAKPARVTLNLPPDLYRQLARWADTAAEAIDVPRVGVQDALRAMIRAVIDDTPATVVALDRLRRDRGTLWRDAALEHKRREGL